MPGLLGKVRPDLVLYNAGVDVHADDALGNMALTDEGVLALCAEQHLSWPRDRCGGP